jgi:hypothetical protein
MGRRRGSGGSSTAGGMHRSARKRRWRILTGVWLFLSFYASQFRVRGMLGEQCLPLPLLCLAFRRIETDIRSLVRSAVQSSAQHKNGAAPLESSPSSSPPTNSKSNPHSSKSSGQDEFDSFQIETRCLRRRCPTDTRRKTRLRPERIRAHLLRRAAPPQRHRAAAARALVVRTQEIPPSHPLPFR